MCGLCFAARGLSTCGAQVPEHEGSVVAACGLRCPAACGILVPRPGFEPASPALEGGFLTTGATREVPFSYFFLSTQNSHEIAHYSLQKRQLKLRKSEQLVQLVQQVRGTTQTQTLISCDLLSPHMISPPFSRSIQNGL